MKFGVCADLNVAPALAKAGFDFLELNVQTHLKPQEPEEAFRPILKQIRACPLPCKAANCFVPANLKITGEDIGRKRLRAYAQVAFDRARRAGIETIVFGSGGARRVPDGFPRNRAWEQLVEFGRMIGPLAGKQGVTVAVEPLNRQECNVLTTVAEGAAYVREVNHPAIRLLADAYHWNRDSDRAEDIVAAGPLLRHVHVATCPGRAAPGCDDMDLAPFFDALLQAGYDGRVSIESQWQDMPSQAPKALAALKVLAKEGP